MSPEVTDPVIGELVLRDHYYERECEEKGSKYQFAIGIYQVENVDARFERARSIFTRLDKLVARAKEHAVGQCYN